MLRTLQILSFATVLLNLNPAAGSAQQAKLSASPTSSVLYGAEWRYSSTANTEIDLQNPDSTANVQAAITFFASSGAVLATKSVALGPGSTASVLASDLAPQLGSGTPAGGIEVSWSPTTVVLNGSMTLSDSALGGVVQRDLIAGYSLDTENSVVGSWYLPTAATQGDLQLFNSSSSAITVTANVYPSKDAAAISLGSIPTHGAAKFALRDLLRTNESIVGSVVLHYSGNAHALLPALTEFQPGTDFIFAPQFTGVHEQPLAGSETLVYPNLTPSLPSSSEVAATPQPHIYLLLSNATAEKLSPSGIALMADPNTRKSNSLSLALPALAPKTSQLVDIADQLRTADIASGPVSLAISSLNGIRDLDVDVISESAQGMTLSQAAGDLVRLSGGSPLYWNLPLRINTTPAAPDGASNSAGASVVYASGLHLGAYALAPADSTSGSNSRLNLGQLLRASTLDRFQNSFPSGVVSGLLIAQADDSPAVLSRECLTTCATNAVIAPSAASFASASPLMATAEEEPVGGSCPSTINVTRTSLSQTSSIGRPVNGTFNYSSALDSGSGTVATYTTADNSANPNTATIGNPNNPVAAPSQGALAKLSASYTCSTYGTTSNPVTWTAPAFGTSCYYIALQSDFYTASGVCKSNRYRGVTYSGTMNAPTGLPAGTYCEWFLEAVKIQGSGELSNGTKFAAASATDCPNCSFTVVSNWATSSGTVPTAGRTVARDVTKIKNGVSIELATSGNPTTYVAEDRGSAITNYRIDIFGGPGLASCTGYGNPILVGSCNAGNDFCPQWVPSP